jgi:hypothetical protein
VGDALSKENEHVAAEIRKSGFPLEIEIADILQRHGWQVIPSSFFYDYDMEQYRETDILAYNHVGAALKGSPNYPYRVTMGLVLECKKREDTALVFFPRPRDPNDLDYGGVGLASIDSFRIARISSLLTSGGSLTAGSLRREIEFGLDPKAFVPATIAREIWGPTEIANFVQARDFRCLANPEKSLAFDIVRLAKTRKRFDRDKERKAIHDSMGGLAKATQERLVLEAEVMQDLLGAALDHEIVQSAPHLRQFYLSYFFPLVIFAGKLKVWKEGDVFDADEVLFDVALRSRHYFHNRLVSVVERGHFDQWLAQFESDAKALVQKITEQRNLLDTEVELLEKNYRPIIGRAETEKPGPRPAS